MRKTDDPTISTDAESGETFIGRWSRRKRSALAEPPVDESGSAQSPQGDAPAPAPAPAPAQADARLPGTAAEPASPADAQAAESAPVLTDADMPDLASIGDDDDYSGFMSPGVSEGLRNKALRQLFMSSQFNVLDGLNDYDDDFTTFEALGDIVTSDMRHRVEMEAEKAEREAQRLLGDNSGQQALDEDATRPRAIEHEAQTDEEHADEQTDEAHGAGGEMSEQSLGDEHDSAGDVAHSRADSSVDESGNENADDGKRLQSGSATSSLSDRDDV